MKINTQQIVDGHVVVVTRDMTEEEETQYLQGLVSEEEPEQTMEERIEYLENVIRELTNNKAN